jgi:hemerythrin-like domain-containing protein
MSGLMSIHAPGKGAATAGFEAPLALLAECHRRVERQCATLQRLAPHLAVHGSDVAAAEAARAVVRYFDLAAPKHHADEEEDLFPALFEAVAGSDAVCLRGLVDALCADHRVLERQWHALRAVLDDVAAQRPARLDEDAVAAFAGRYAAHIAREEGELLPMAQRLLDEEVVARLGQAMRRRRGDTGAAA